MQVIFGIGALWGTRTDVTGVGPDQFAILQENAIDFNYELKELYSQLGFPVDIARGKGKITGKAKMARVFGRLYADLFFGTTVTTTGTTVSENEAANIPASTPFSVTVSNAANFQGDLGVFFTGAHGIRLMEVTTPTVSGQYTANPSTGVYGFATSDAGKSVVISYLYSGAAVVQLTITNQFMGFTPTFSGVFYQNRATQGAAGQLTLVLNLCVSQRLTFPSRLDDYGIPDFDFQALSPASGTIGTLSTSE
jgi:hypothetical protein